MPSPTSKPVNHYTVHASAGAGKTTKLIKELINSIDSHRKKQNEFPSIIVTTFTRNATHEVKERVISKATKEEDWDLVHAIHQSNQILISTLHGILYSFLKKYRPHRFNYVLMMNKRQKNMGIRSVLRDILQDSSFLPLLRFYAFEKLCDFMEFYLDNIHINPQIKPIDQKEMDQEWWDEIHQLPVETSQIKDASLAYSFLKEQQKQKNIRADQFTHLFKKNHPQHYKEMEEQYLLFQKCFNLFQPRWEDYKKRRGWIQIEDLEYEVLKMIKNKSPELNSFSKEYSEWFIDEYQDISPSQELILQHLTQSAQKVWAVGDPQQSIYLFRKADPQVFERRVQKSSVEKNHYNYRSTPQMISFFKDLFKNKFEPMIPKKDSKNSSDPSVYFLINQNEISSLSEQINHFLQKGAKPKDICILCKKNKDAQRIGYQLKELGFPIQLHAKNSLKREILDTLFLLRFLSHPLDNKNLIGVLRTPYFYMPDSQIAKYSNKKEFLWKNLMKNQKEDKTVCSLNHLLNKAQQEGFSHALFEAFKNHFMIDLCYLQDPTQEKEKNLWNFLLELQKKEEEFGFRINQFIEEKLSQAQDYEVDTGSAACKPLNFIQVMSIHQSKGLEFDHVILHKADQQLIPSDKSYFVIDQSKWSFSIRDEEGENVCPLFQTKSKDRKKERELQEQDRLLYVAATRAKKSFTFMISQNYWNNKWKDSLNYWPKRFSYFNEIKKIDEEKENQIVKKDSYQIKIQHHSKITSSLCVLHKEEKSPLLSPLHLETTPSLKTIECSTLSSLNIPMTQKIESSYEGTKLHFIMNRLQKNIEQKGFPEEWKSVCHYVLSLKEIPIKQIMQKGFSEWGFVYKEKNYQIKGVVDLWGIVENTLWVVDYKSSKKISKEFWTQLGLYAFALQKNSQIKKIKMCVVQPLTQEYKIKEADNEFLNSIQSFITNYK